MALISGEVVSLNSSDVMMHAVGQAVFVRHGDTTVGSGVVDDDNSFSIEVPDDIAGELEVHLGMFNAAPTCFDYEGQDVHLQVFLSNVNNFIA